jgi:hypothetical protein
MGRVVVFEHLSVLEAEHDGKQQEERGMDGEAPAPIAVEVFHGPSTR